MSLASLRDVGAHYLRRARELAKPRPIGRPRKGEARTDTIHDRALELRRALRRARYYYVSAARLVIVQREADRRLDATRNNRDVVQRTEHQVGSGA